MEIPSNIVFSTDPTFDNSIIDEALKETDYQLIAIKKLSAYLT